MNPIKKIFAKASCFFSSVKNFSLSAMSIQEFAYRIEEINVVTNRIVIQCYGMRTLIKTTFSEAIYDSTILHGLPPKQASWLGYYYGKSLWETSANKKTNKKQEINFLPRFNKERFKIISMDRYSNITYLDMTLNKTYTEYPVEIIKNKYVITHLGSSQACYIGILAGMEATKHGANIFSTPIKPTLTLIK